MNNEEVVKKVQEKAKEIGHCLCGLYECPCDVYKKHNVCKCAIVHRKELNEE